MDVNNVDSENCAGFFGKIPSHGDFINRRVARSFLDPWDSWLQQAISYSKENLANAWMDIYLTSPIWNFYLAPGVCGDQPMAGILMPSVDKVGRYFPLTIVNAISDQIASCDSAFSNQEWFRKAERLALTALSDSFDFEEFDKKVGELHLDANNSTTLDQTDLHPYGAMHLTLGPISNNSSNASNLANHFLTSTYSAQHSVWWSNGSQRMQACVIACTGLPPVDGFTAFLDGQWSNWGWHNGTDLSSSNKNSIDGMWNL